MACGKLNLADLPKLPKLKNGRLVLAFSGWMDGGFVSTGTVKWMIDHLRAKSLAEIEAEGYYVHSFPGSMELATLLRPNVTVKHGLVRNLEMPGNHFFVHEKQNLVLFVGREPNLHWEEFAQRMFELCSMVNVTRVLFVGTFAGQAPHTRLPRLYATVSEAKLKRALKGAGVRLSTYEGPASFASYLMVEAPRHEVEMINLVAEIPAYIEGANLMSIEAVTRRLGLILKLKVDMSPMRLASDEWESRVSAAVQKDESLAKKIRKLEEQYDQELLEEG